VGDDCALHVEVTDVNTCLHELKTGKAPGCDSITVEHLIHSHPIVIVLLSILFNALLQHSYVPHAFAEGLLVLLLKNNDLDNTNVDNYRGITLSSVVSKLFESLSHQDI